MEQIKMWHLGFVIAMETIGFVLSALSLHDYASMHKPHQIINMTQPPSTLSFGLHTQGQQHKEFVFMD